jgi:hypothetical protein
MNAAQTDTHQVPPLRNPAPLLSERELDRAIAANRELVDRLDSLPMRLDALDAGIDLDALDEDELDNRRRALGAEHRVTLVVLCGLCAIAGYLAGVVHAAGVAP